MINFDPPADSDTYVHRIGRTGRAGAKGLGITLVAPTEHRDVTRIAASLGLEHSLAAPGHQHRAHAAPAAANRGRPRRRGRQSRRRSRGRAY